MSQFWVNGKPTTGPEDWKWGLREPEKQWRPGFSAWALAHSWETARGFPPEIERLLMPHFANVTFVKGLVEYPIPMPGRGYASYNDVFVQASSIERDLCITIEGKVAETLGPTLAEWRNGSPNREARLSSILDLTGLPPQIPQTIRYQLLHRMASPVIAAKTIFNAKHAIMIIHSFSEVDRSFHDFSAFLALYGVGHVETGKLYELKSVGDITLYAGWARGDKRFLLGE